MDHTRAVTSVSSASRTQMYPGGDSKHHWPKLCLNTLRWAKKQGALVGPAHSGWGLIVPGDELPNYNPPPFDGIGANEYIVDVTHTVEGPDGKTGTRSRFSFHGRYALRMGTQYLVSYSQLRIPYPDQRGDGFPLYLWRAGGTGPAPMSNSTTKLTFNEWCEGIRRGRNYVGDGRSHLIGFQINDVEMGVGDSTVRLDKPATVTARVKAAALSAGETIPRITGSPLRKETLLAH